MEKELIKGAKDFRIKKVYLKGKALFYPHVLVEKSIFRFFSLSKWYRIGWHGRNDFGIYPVDEDIHGKNTFEEAQDIIEKFKKELDFEKDKVISFLKVN